MGLDDRILMCSRFEQNCKRMLRYERIHGRLPDEERARYNLRPTNTVWTIDAEGWRDRSWSLVPQWSKERRLKYATFNARSETVDEKATFRHAWRHSQRCLIPASGYYEWLGPKGSKRCHYVTRADDEGLGIAGLWEHWERDGDAIDSCTMITVPAAAEIGWLHHRMPLMFGPADEDVWLHASADEAAELFTRQPPALEISPIDSPPSR